MRQPKKDQLCLLGTAPFHQSPTVITMMMELSSPFVSDGPEDLEEPKTEQSARATKAVEEGSGRT